MCQPRRWWWGLLPLAALWFAATALLAPEIESELTHRLTTTVAKDMPWIKPAIEGRDVFIEGTAPSAASQGRALAAALQVPGVRLATANPSEIAPVTKPFTWGATIDAGKVTLSGFVEADGMREKLLAEAHKRLPGLNLVDDMKDARGAPPEALAMSASALSQLARLKSGSVALSDNILSIRGTAADQATAAAVTAAVKQLPPPLQIGAVDIAAPAPPPAPVAAAPKAPALPVERPYVWQASRDGDVMTLTGSAPAEVARLQSLAGARAAALNGRVVDQLKLASGVPTGVDFGAATTFATIQLGQLRNGLARITDNALVIEGEAVSAAAYRAVTAATAGSLPGGLKLERAAITPPLVQNYVWKAVRTLKALRFDGHYPDDDVRRTMISALQRFPNSLALDDTTSIAGGAPAGFGAALALGLEQLSRLEQGEASIAGGRLTISGVAPSERIANEIKDVAVKLDGPIPTQTTLTFPVSVAPPVAPAAPPAVAAPAPTPPAVIAKPAPEVVAACTADLAASVKSGKILFESSRAVVLPSSQPVINQIADVMKRCPAMRIEVAGHTDSSGTAGFNETLSQDRADAIVELLAKAGIAAPRMKANGYGSSQPVADNADPAGRTKNRRIEFNVVE